MYPTLLKAGAVALVALAAASAGTWNATLEPTTGNTVFIMVIAAGCMHQESCIPVTLDPGTVACYNVDKLICSLVVICHENLAIIRMQGISRINNLFSIGQCVCISGCPGIYFGVEVETCEQCPGSCPVNTCIFH